MDSPDSSKSITVILPVYNEGEALEGSVGTILAHLDAIGEIQFRVLIVDDGSTDASNDVATRLAEQHPNISILGFNRHFGKEAAIDAGLDHTDSDAVIVMDSDLQHPPELIPEMVSHWRHGIAVVEAVKISRGRQSFLEGKIEEK